MKALSLLYLPGWNIKIRFLYANLTSFKYEVIAISRVLKWFKISLLETGKGGFKYHLAEELERGGDKGKYLFQS